MSNDNRFDLWLAQFAPTIPARLRECALKAFQQGKVSQDRFGEPLNMAGMEPYNLPQYLEGFHITRQIIEKAYEYGIEVSNQE